jgi:hypothetical protein
MLSTRFDDTKGPTAENVEGLLVAPRIVLLRLHCAEKQVSLEFDSAARPSWNFFPVARDVQAIVARGKCAHLVRTPA